MEEGVIGAPRCNACNARCEAVIVYIDWAVANPTAFHDTLKMTSAQTHIHVRAKTTPVLSCRLRLERDKLCLAMKCKNGNESIET